MPASAKWRRQLAGGWPEIAGPWQRGAQENTEDAWFWSGTLDPHGAVNLDISYQVAALKSLAYRVGEQNGNPVRQLRIAFHRTDLDSMRFESGDGPKPATEATASWERRDFLAPDFFSATIVESRSLFASLSQLLEIGPVICLLFLLAMSAGILARQELTAVQMLTIAAVYALYFPLILYLSAHFSFKVALVIAVAVPGALLLNYARWLLGGRLGLPAGAAFLALYWVFPTLAAFAGWNRGMVLLCLGVVTLWVLINLQNQALRRKAAIVALACLCFGPRSTRAAEIQVVLPAELAAKLAGAQHENASAVVSFEPVQYQVRQEDGHFRVEAQAPFRSLRAGEAIVPLFDTPVYLLEGSRVDSAVTNLAGIVTATNRLGLFVQNAGAGTVRLAYRVPVVNHEGKRRAEIPLLAGLAGDVRLESTRGDFEFLSGSLWAASSTGKTTVYEIGVTGAEPLVVEWREQGRLEPAMTNRPPETTGEFYGIGVTRAQNLTVVNSDGSCTHFAEIELPSFQTEDFRLKLPPKARLISVSVNGNEVGSPVVEDQICRVRLPARGAQQTAHRLSFRIACPPLRLGFIGTAELVLPEVFQTTGTLEWVVALPSGFQAQVITSGLELQKTTPDLGRFGDYGRILKSHAQTYLAKDLAPPGAVSLSFKCIASQFRCSMRRDHHPALDPGWPKSICIERTATKPKRSNSRPTHGANQPMKTFLWLQTIAFSMLCWIAWVVAGALGDHVRFHMVPLDHLPLAVLPLVPHPKWLLFCPLPWIAYTAWLSRKQNLTVASVLIFSGTLSVAVMVIVCAVVLGCLALSW